MPDIPHLPLAALLVFLLGCALILAGRRHARALTALLAGAAAVLFLVGVELAFDHLGVPSGDAEAGRLFWPKK